MEIFRRKADLYNWFMMICRRNGIVSTLERYQDITDRRNMGESKQKTAREREYSRNSELKY